MKNFRSTTILTIIGARPQFIKAAMVSRAIVEMKQAGVEQVVEEIIHTGQHYDRNMSQVFFEQMGIPRPAKTMQFGGLGHGAMTGRMIEALELEILAREPDYVLVYGDTNSTLAGALAAAKLHVPVAHVEAGLRSFNKTMPEELNRILTDHVSSLLLCPTSAAVNNLAQERITHRVHHVGDVMYDAALVFGQLADRQSVILKTLQLSPGQYRLATVHRAENTDDLPRLENIFSAFIEMANESCPLVLPLHPRVASRLAKCPLERAIRDNTHLKLIDPVSFLDMVMLEKHATTILTDSGGVQKEAYFHAVPCVTLRDETEWLETVQSGWNQLVGADSDAILTAINRVSMGQPIAEYGQGHASHEIIQKLSYIERHLG